MRQTQNSRDAATAARDLNTLRETVQARYGAAARKVTAGEAGVSCCGPAAESSGCCGATTERWDPITANLYDDIWRVRRFFSCTGITR